MTNTLRHAIAFTATLPIAFLAHEAGLEPVHAAAVAATLPGAHAAIDLVVHGPDLGFRQLGALASVPLQLPSSVGSREGRPHRPKR